MFMGSEYTANRRQNATGGAHKRGARSEPTCGRFLQADPLGYDDGLNIYDYVKGDPINLVDPSGLACIGYQEWGSVSTDSDGTAVVTGGRFRTVCWNESGSGGGQGDVRGGGGTGGNYVDNVVKPATERAAREAERLAKRVACRIAQTGVGMQDSARTTGEVGVGLAAVGSVGIVAGAITGNVPLVGFGTVTAGTGATIVTASGVVSLAGSLLEAVGGNPGNALTRGITRAFRLLSPNPISTNRSNDAATSRKVIPACR